MADQLRASVSLDSFHGSRYYPPKAFNPLSNLVPCRNSVDAGCSQLNFALNSSSSAGFKAVQGRHSLEFQSSFLHDGTVQRCSWASGLHSWTYDGRTSRRKAGVARAAGPAGTGIRKSATGGTVPTKPGHFLLIGVAVAYMSIIVIIPFINVFVQAFSFGLRPFINNLLDPAFQSAVRMTLTIAGIVVPMNTLFGLIIAIWVTRHDFPGKALLLSAIDLPFSISPVVVGLMLMLLYGRQGLFAPLLRALDFEVVFALPGMIIATCFVTLPFVVREVIPVLQEMDPYEEEAARTMGANDWEVRFYSGCLSFVLLLRLNTRPSYFGLGSVAASHVDAVFVLAIQVFWQVTLPNIRLGLLYGVTLCNAVSKKFALFYHLFLWLFYVYVIALLLLLFQCV